MRGHLRRVAAALGHAGRTGRDLGLAGLVLLVGVPVWLLPPRVASGVGAAVGRLAYHVWPTGRRVAVINLRRAYGPALTRAAAARRARAAFAHMGRSLAEGVAYSRRLRRRPAGWERLYDVDDAALERRIVDDPRPCVFVTGHVGSWEAALLLAAQRVGAAGAAIVRRIDNPFVDALVRRLRVREPGQLIDKRHGATAALARLRAGDSVALLLDENAGWRGLFVDFFGRPASTARTAALLALLTGSPVVVGVAVRRPARHRLRFRLRLIEPAGEGPAAVRALTATIVSQLESWIRDDPEQWRWMHWRWKTRPDGTEERYGRRELQAAFADKGSVPVTTRRPTEGDQHV